MAKKKQKTFNISVDPAQVVYTSISKSSGGYNNARMVVKANDKEYMSISYEWEGSGVPAFAINLMSFMQKNGVETSGVWKGQEKAYEEYAAQCGNKKKTKKKDKTKKSDKEM